MASHILPFKDSKDVERFNPDKRLGPANGILLSPVFDALFDRHFKSFECSVKIILCDKIEGAAYARIGVTGNEKFRTTSVSADLKGMLGMRDRQEEYLRRHRLELVWFQK